MKQAFIFTFFYLLSLNAYPQGQDIVIGRTYSISSTVLNEERQIAVFTPKSNLTENQKYQVLYLLDAEWNFHFVSALVDKLVSNGDIPPMIVVGVFNNNRSKDLTPAGTNDNENIYGGAEPFLNFLTDELQAWVESNFKTHPYKVLAGHSFGGLFTVFSMIKKPGAFQSYIALSPSLGRNNEQQLSLANEYFSSGEIFPDKLYIAVGNEGGLTYSSTKKFVDILDDEATNKFNYKFEHLKEESHVSITTQGFINGFKYLYADYNPENMPELDEIFLIEQHYQALSKRFGYPIKIPEEYYQRFIKEQMAERELDYALFILSKYQNDYPDSKQLKLLFADVYLLMGDFNKAKSHYLELKESGFENERIEKIIKELEK